MRRKNRYDTDRITPDAVRDYTIEPVANPVDKQERFTPQLNGDSERLRATAEGLAALAKGLTDVNILAARQASENAIEATAKTEEKNRKDWASVSRNVKGMAIFNPYNKEAFRTLRAKELAENGILKLKELETKCASLTPEEFDTERNTIQEEVLKNMQSEGLRAKHTANYLIRFQDAQEQLKTHYATKNAEHNYNVLQNQIVTTMSKDIATLTMDNYSEGWEAALKNLENTANGLGMNNQKQFELFTRAVNQYLVDNVEDIDPEQFIMAVGQTKINGQPLSDFDPNYTESMKQLLIKAKRAKYENDSLDLQIEQLRLQKATLAANAEMFKLMSDPNTTDAEILNKANELIEAGGMEAIGFGFLQSVVNDKNTLLTLRTTTTNPETNDALMSKYISGILTQDDIINAFQNKQLSPRDASSFFNAIQSETQESYTEQFRALKELYLDNNSTVDLGEQNKTALIKATYEVTSNPNFTKSQKAEAINRLKGVAEQMDAQNQLQQSKDPNKLLSAEYMKTQHAHTQSSAEAQRYMAKLGLLRNQAGWRDSNIKVSSPMQSSRTVTGADGKTVTREHKGTDITTQIGRTVVAPKSGTVVASGYEKTMGNYVLFQLDDGRFIKLLHLQAHNIPKAGKKVREGDTLAFVGHSGFTTTKDTGILHVECFDKRMRLVDPKQFIEGK